MLTFVCPLRRSILLSIAAIGSLAFAISPTSSPLTSPLPIPPPDPPEGESWPRRLDLTRAGQLCLEEVYHPACERLDHAGRGVGQPRVVACEAGE